MAKRNVDRLQGEIEELFSELWQVPRYAGLRHGFRPQVDCFRSDDPAEVTVVVELPGVEVADIEILASPGALVVRGERRRPRTPGRHYQQMELDYGPFQRQIALPEDVDIARSHATYERGLLTILLPIAQQQTGSGRVSIEVTSGS